MGFQKRTHTCGELREAHIDRVVTLNGWVDTRRDHGGVVFIDLRDRWGITQVVFDPSEAPEYHELAQGLRSEDVIAVEGQVVERPEGMWNEKLPTGRIELRKCSAQLLNRSRAAPFAVKDDLDVGFETRLKYRFIDLRRPGMMRSILTRHRMFSSIRKYLDARDFVDVETPMLTRSTPEGARDYLVPSRVNAGMFYALPQSPQLFKQLLMVAGYERYYQIVRCFRDEDLRADRQPEFTQLDVEMSFINEEDVIELISGLLRHVFEEILKVDLPEPIPRMSYAEAMLHYGSDAPDTRYELLIQDISDLAEESSFRVFTSTVQNGGCVRGLAIPGGAAFSRKELDDLVERARQLGAKGLAWIKWADQGLQSPIVKFFPEELMSQILRRLGAEKGSVTVFVADKSGVAAGVLGAIRSQMAARLDMIPKGVFAPVWVVEFPLFEPDEAGNPAPSHHPFTAPFPEDLERLESDPFAVRARAYDIVLNGVEIGGGSVRIHQPDLQERVFRMLRIGHDEGRQKFGFLLDAFTYGAPPHGGIALGLDRLVMLGLGLSSLREVIAFPKTQRAQCLLTGAPTAVDERQLREIHIKSLLDE